LRSPNWPKHYSSRWRIRDAGVALAGHGCGGHGGLHRSTDESAAPLDAPEESAAPGDRLRGADHAPSTLSGPRARPSDAEALSAPGRDSRLEPRALLGNPAFYERVRAALQGPRLCARIHRAGRRILVRPRLPWHRHLHRRALRHVLDDGGPQDAPFASLCARHQSQKWPHHRRSGQRPRAF
jgi:hypothetical protein